MNTVSVRLSAEELKKIRALSKQEGKGKSTVVRELIREGFIYKSLQAYHEGRRSIGTLAQDLGISISATIDLLSNFGIEAPVTYDDYLESVETLQKIK